MVRPKRTHSRAFALGPCSKLQGLLCLNQHPLRTLASIAGSDELPENQLGGISVLSVRCDAKSSKPTRLGLETVVVSAQPRQSRWRCHTRSASAAPPKWKSIRIVGRLQCPGSVISTKSSTTFERFLHNRTKKYAMSDQAYRTVGFSNVNLNIQSRTAIQPNT